MLETTPPMDWETFARLWDHDTVRNWVPGYTDYRDAFAYLLHLRRPHVACLTIPVQLQPLLIATFLQAPGCQMWVQEASAGYVKLAVWLPASPPAPPPAPPPTLSPS